MQRLRHIAQLSLTSLIYPGATHTRFEHSLGVAELAGRIFDTLSRPGAVHHSVVPLLGPLFDDLSRPYLRYIVRMAALCHDMGHLPFSHGAEKHLFPEGFDHEMMTVEIVERGPLVDLFGNLEVSVRPTDVSRVAVGPEYFPSAPFSYIDLLLTDILTGDVFGADRMDYLLRDSLHAGVKYGNYDLFRLLNTLRILPSPGQERDGSAVPRIGVEEGGLRSAEALLLARYFMFDQVYFHDVRRSIDLHLSDFMAEFAKSQFGSGKFPTNSFDYLRWTDLELLGTMRLAAQDSNMLGHVSADRILNRSFFKLVWQPTQDEIDNNENIGTLVFEGIRDVLGDDNVMRDYIPPSRPYTDFPVLRRDGSVVSARQLSQVLSSLPMNSVDSVYVRPDLVARAYDWLAMNRELVSRKLSTEEESV